MNNLEEINAQFNRELAQQIGGTLPKGFVYQLGMPSEALLSRLENLPIEMHSGTLAIKSSADYISQHPFLLSEIKDLPQVLAFPIAVFESESNPNRTVIFTELRDANGSNFVVIIGIFRSRGRNTNAVNSVVSLYPKESAVHIAKWFEGKLNADIGRDLLCWVDKEKALNWLANNSSYVNSVGMSINRIAKVINNFQNPKNLTQKASKNSVRHRRIRI